MEESSSAGEAAPAHMKVAAATETVESAVEVVAETAPEKVEVAAEAEKVAEAEPVKEEKEAVVAA